ncbi:uncharacterized protein LOC143242002 [Tachypleus tridentatus]|uniref:uncharacterized protein LOC143242002 n=1 Tax=Tachypleus tridentatus TaxID=6853 RepID=UPI003FD5C359
MIEAAVKFATVVQDCSDYETIGLLMTVIKQGLLERNSATCKQIQCDSFTFVCSEELDGKKQTLETTWTVKAAYEPDKDDLHENVVSLIETIQYETQRIITSDPEFKHELQDSGATLLVESFNDTHFALVCQERGFVVDIDTDICRECPTGNYEEDGQCKQCPANHYQDQTGQIQCESCPRGTISHAGSRTRADCKAVSVKSRLALPGAVREQAYRDACKPNPCQNDGFCIRVGRDSYRCQCRHGYKGRECQVPYCPERFCYNGGSCSLYFTGVLGCMCPPEFTGFHCENRIEIDPCLHNKCQNKEDASLLRRITRVLVLLDIQVINYHSLFLLLKIKYSRKIERDCEIELFVVGLYVLRRCSDHGTMYQLF